MKITVDDVAKVATLARLRLSEVELRTFTEQLGSVLSYVEKLDELDTASVETTSHVVPLDCPTRVDEPQEAAAREEIMGEAPAVAEGHFLVPRVID